jgi:hypothetical protein
LLQFGVRTCSLVQPEAEVSCFEFSMLFVLHMRYDRYSICYYNDECSIYREHKVTIHERMHPLNNHQLFLITIYLLYDIVNNYISNYYL